jgi:general secretion pathway protein D
MAQARMKRLAGCLWCLALVLFAVSLPARAADGDLQPPMESVGQPVVGTNLHIRSAVDDEKTAGAASDEVAEGQPPAEEVKKELPPVVKVEPTSIPLSSPVPKVSAPETPVPLMPVAEAPAKADMSAVPVENVPPPASASQVEGGIFEGSGMVAGDQARKSSAESGGDKNTSINFVDTDVHDIVKAVLGDMLHLNYVIAPSVQGKITIKVNQPLEHKDILPILDTAFRMNNLAIVPGPNVTKVVPLAEAPRQARVLSSASKHRDVAGFGLQIVPLHYISAEEMMKVLSRISSDGGVAPVEGLGNVLILSGTEEDRSAMLDVIESFDVDWLSGMSFGLFPLKEADATSLTTELWEVLGTENGPMSKVVRLVAFERLNAILAISAQPKYLQEIQSWITRLDVDHAPSQRRIWVYQVQNGRAKDLSETLGKLIYAQQSSGKADAKSDMKVKQSSLTPPPPGGLMLGGKSGAGDGASSMKDSVDNLIAHAGDTNTAKGGEDLTGPAEKIIADETTNSLVVWATKSEFSLIEDALKKLDLVPMQVRIEAVIAEVTLNDDLRYGVQYLLQHDKKGVILTNSATSTIASTLPGFSAFALSSDISGILDLLQSRTSVHVISSPQLMVLNNQTAVLQVGDQVPVATQSAVSVLTPDAPVVNSIEMKDTGVILKVTPRVNASGMVLLDVAQEVSDVATTTSSTINSPTIQERKIASTVAVRDGQTIALGGLIKDSTTGGRSGIPLLQDIPVLGNLFSTTTDSTARTELLALITPRIVRNDHDVRTVTREMRDQMHAVQPMVADRIPE